jgi:hypothetical protein
LSLIIAETYNIEVQTGGEQIESLDSPVYMQIYGTTTITPKLFLEPKNGLFTKDSTAKFSISSNNVGQVKRTIKIIFQILYLYFLDPKNYNWT